MAIPSKPFRPMSRRARKVPRRQYNWMGGVCEKMSGFLNQPGYESDRIRMPLTPLTSKPRFVEITNSLTGAADVLFKYSHYGATWMRGDWAPITVGTYGWTEFRLPKGTRVWVIYHEQSSEWLPTWIPDVRFELKEDLAKNGSADAYLLEWQANQYAINSDIVFPVYDGLDTMEGTGRSSVGSGLHGDRGFAQWCGDRLVFEIKQLGCD